MLKRWHSSLSAAPMMTRKAAPLLCVITGAATGLVLSLGAGSLLVAIGATVLGAVLGGVAAALPLILYEGLKAYTLPVLIFGAFLSAMIVLIRLLLGI